MEEMIKITETKGKKTVSAKELYEFLGHNKAVWKRWYKKNIEQNPFATEGKDWIGFNTRLNHNDTKDFTLTLEFAKKLAMMSKTEKGNMIQEYFLKMEKLAHQIFRPTPTIEDHTKKEIQIKNSKEVNAYQYTLGGVESVVEYNRMNCKIHTGKYPNEIKAEAKKNNLPSKMRTSAKEVIRNTDPISACSMSLTDDMVKMGGNLEEAAKISNTHGRAIFAYMLNNGIVPGELRK